MWSPSEAASFMRPLISSVTLISQSSDNLAAATTEDTVLSGASMAGISSLPLKATTWLMNRSAWSRSSSACALKNAANSLNPSTSK